MDKIGLMLKYFCIFKNYDDSFLSYMIFYETELSLQNKRKERKCIIYKECSLEWLCKENIDTVRGPEGTR